MTRDERTLGVTLGLLLPFAVGAGMVLVRGEISSTVTALVLACTVIVAARMGGRVGGIAAALMAAATFDFFHTVPYLSLKIANGDDVLITLLLLVTGLLVGGLAGSVATNRNVMQHRYRATSAVTRVLGVAHAGPIEDVELAVRAELTELLAAKDCWFTTDVVALPLLEREGSWVQGEEIAEDGYTLPVDGVQIPVETGGHRFGALVCMPQRGAGVPTANRRTAYALGEVLALALGARTAA
jgi:K+-sensing histidine kinase KdpD